MPPQSAEGSMEQDRRAGRQRKAASTVRDADVDDDDHDDGGGEVERAAIGVGGDGKANAEEEEEQEEAGIDARGVSHPSGGRTDLRVALENPDKIDHLFVDEEAASSPSVASSLGSSSPAMRHAGQRSRLTRQSEGGARKTRSLHTMNGTSRHSVGSDDRAARSQVLPGALFVSCNGMFRDCLVVCDRDKVPGGGGQRVQTGGPAELGCRCRSRR